MRPEEAPLAQRRISRKAAPGKKKVKEKGKTEKAASTDDKLALVASAIDEAIENIRGKLTADELKGSVSDLVRLIQLRKELADEAPKQVTVRWVEEWNNSPANEE